MKTVEQNKEVIEAFELMDECLKLAIELIKIANQNGKDYMVEWAYETIEICRKYLGKDIKGYGQDVEVKQRINRAKKVIKELTNKMELIK